MPSYVQLYLGTPGVCLGVECVKLLSLEHGINQENDGPPNPLLDPESVFLESQKGYWTPRSIFADFDPSTPSSLLAQDPSIRVPCLSPNPGFSSGGAVTWACAMDPSSGLATQLIDQVQAQLEACDSMEAIFISAALSGGSGSGLASRILDDLSDSAPHVPKVLSGILPSPNAPLTALAAYNTVFALGSARECADLVLLSDNAAASRAAALCGAPRPDPRAANAVLAQQFSAFTLGTRFRGPGGAVPLRLDGLRATLVPLPSTNLCYSALGPLVSRDRAAKQPLSLPDITSSVLDPLTPGTLLDLDATRGQVVGATLQYRGGGGGGGRALSLESVRAAIGAADARRSLKRVEWCTAGVRVGLTPFPMRVPPGTKEYLEGAYEVPESVLFTVNSTAIAAQASPLARLAAAHERFASSGSHVHVLEEHGVDMDDLDQARESLLDTMADYAALGGGGGEGRAAYGQAAATPSWPAGAAGTATKAF